MAESQDIIAALPSLAQGGAWLLLAGVLIWILRVLMKRMDAQDEAHRKERKDQDELHQKRVQSMMDSHFAERKDWVSKIESATDGFAEATTNQGDRIARAIEDALRRARP